MKILRIIDKQGYFLRDDFTFNQVDEIGLDVPPSRGNYKPKWNGTEWIEGLTLEELTEKKAELNCKITPEKVTRLQLRVQLRFILESEGKSLAIIQDAIDNYLTGMDRIQADEAWNGATNIKRDNALIGMIGQVLAMSNEEIDQVFIDASKVDLND